MPILKNQQIHEADTQPIAIEQQHQKPRALYCRLLFFIVVTNIVTLILAVATTLWIINNLDIVSEILPVELVLRAPHISGSPSQTLPSQESPIETSLLRPISTSKALAPKQSDATVPVAKSTDVPTATATDVPTATATDVPTATATDVRTATATDVPTATRTSVPTAEPTAVTREIQDFPEYICTEGAVNLRQGAGYTNFGLVGQIFPGTRYQVVGAVEGESVYGNTTWYRIKHARKTAYVTAELTHLCSAQLQAPAQPQLQPQVQQPQPQPQPRFSCPSKPSCGNVSSCEEAHFIWKQCGYSRADGDGDGVPCERVCPGG